MTALETEIPHATPIVCTTGEFKKETVITNKLPCDKYGYPVKDATTIISYIMINMKVYIDPDNQLKLEFPKWLTEGNYVKNTVDEFVSIITHQIKYNWTGSSSPIQFENDFKEVQSDMLKDIYDREVLIMKSRNNLMQKVITDMSINLKDSKLDIGIPNWFTCDKKYSSAMKDGIIKEITEAAIDSMSLKYGLECNYYTIINNS